MQPDLIYRNFDGLDVAFTGCLPRDLLAALDAAKAQAQAEMRPALLAWNGLEMHVAETGAKGGYAYRVSTGPEGCAWFFKKSGNNDGWNIRVSCGSLFIASNGLLGAREGLDDFLRGIGVKSSSHSIGRIDYCCDFIDDEFELDPTAFVMHSASTRKDHGETSGDGSISIAGKSGFYTSVTVGMMPGRQVILYDKRREIVAHKKEYWWEIWNQHRERDGKPPLTGAERIWRVEIRAGKRHLKDDWNITTWEDLLDRGGDLLREAMGKVRLTEGDQVNRAQRPLHPIWAAAQATIAADLRHMSCGIDAGPVREVIRAQAIEMYRAQIVGLSASYAVALGMTAAQAGEIADAVADDIADMQRDDRDGYLKKMEKAAERQIFVKGRVRDVRERFGRASRASSSIDESAVYFYSHIGRTAKRTVDLFARQDVRRNL